jgi:hypothetical protein
MDRSAINRALAKPTGEHFVLQQPRQGTENGLIDESGPTPQKTSVEPKSDRTAPQSTEVRLLHRSGGVAR